MKKVLLLTSSGGGGTLSASTAIANFLQKEYDVTTKHIFKELLHSIDFCHVLTFKKYSCEDVYNILIPRKSFRTLTMLYYVGKWYIRMRKRYIRAIVKEYLMHNKPSLIISVVPILNDIILSVAQELAIPFLLIPTDLDVHMYITHLNNPMHKQFRIGVPFDDTQLLAPLKKNLFPQECISVLGAPLRYDFFTTKNVSLLKEEFNIPFDKPVIMILMGAQGSHEIERYLNQLTKIDHSLHIVVCIGKNGKQVFDIIVPEHIGITWIEFTPRIADLMALSDIIFTKSGSLSVYEAIYMNTPLVLDATSTVLPWERLNHDFIKKHDYGTSIAYYSDIAPLITDLLNNPEKLMRYKNNLEKLRKENIEEQIKKCISEMLL